MVLMMVLMLVFFLAPGSGAYQMNAHEATQMTTQSLDRDSAKPDPRDP